MNSRYTNMKPASYSVPEMDCRNSAAESRGERTPLKIPLMRWYTLGRIRAN